MPSSTQLRKGRETIAPGRLSAEHIFTTYQPGFGDCWGTASFLLRMSEVSGQATKVSRIDERVVQIAQRLRGTGTLQEVAHPADAVLMSPQRIEQFVRAQGYAPHAVIPWSEVLGDIYLRTSTVWRPNASRKICFHLTPSRIGPASCRPQDIELLRETLRYRGYRCVELGSHLDLDENIAQVASAEFFIGVDSGVSHLVHSVGAPIHLVRNHLPIHHILTTHARKRFWLYEDIRDFLSASGLSMEGGA